MCRWGGPTPFRLGFVERESNCSAGVSSPSDSLHSFCLAGGLVVLSLRYAWAKRLLVPIKVEALKIVEKEVQTWPRIVASALGGLAAITAGILWGVRPPMPDWWTFGDRRWLPGSWFVGSTLIVSGVVALALMTYSFRKFRRPRASSHRGDSSP
ncbi:hypothetical protein [Arthrobacter crystallopoietes]|uniref:hypothetical protein n=1 Tax=Crystallibacter crystallopoietes TaxID=37928 RepID=UPI0011110971|nr:hypothetical protein [Arthrobacter crystallopoietes]